MINSNPIYIKDFILSILSFESKYVFHDNASKYLSCLQRKTYYTGFHRAYSKERGCLLQRHFRKRKILFAETPAGYLIPDSGSISINGLLLNDKNIKLLEKVLPRSLRISICKRIMDGS